MSEEIPKFEQVNENPISREIIAGEIIALARELQNRGESLPFLGLKPESLAELKKCDEEYPGYTTPTDEIIRRMTEKGLKVSFGAHPESGNVFILPADSDDIEQDSIPLEHFLITEDMDPNLKKLISKVTTFKELR